MKLGEIKIEALKLMFADYTDDLSMENLAALKSDENFGRYVNSMPGAINRCYNRLEDTKVIPLKKVTISKEQGTEQNGRIRYNLSELISDFGTLDRVIAETETSYNGNCEYVMETNSIVMLPSIEDELTFVYSPALARISSSTADDTEIELPDKIASVIPYFIKGDLFREDEPAEAAEARNLFEASIDATNNDIKRRQTSIKTVFSQTEG